jgi:rare lipoprotein A
MTAAHKTLPLPTIANVTSLETGKSIVVLVDDRGPFYENRIIYLSASAAKELGIYDKGTGKVRVTALPKESDAFSMYLKHHGIFKNRKPRRWVEVYSQEIGGKGGYRDLTNVSAKNLMANETDIFAKEHAKWKNITKEEKVVPEKSLKTLLKKASFKRVAFSAKNQRLQKK